VKLASLPIYQLIGNDYENPQIVIGLKAAQQWNLSAGQQVEIKAGMCKSKVRVNVSQDINDEHLAVSNSVLNTLNLPNQLSITIYYNSTSRCLCLGPIVGLYAIRQKNKIHPYGEINSLLQELQLAGIQKGSLVYVFSPQSITLGNPTLYGYYYDFTKKHWYGRKFPIPDVVYDRILSRTLQKKSEVKATRRFLLEVPSVHYFNQGYLDKWSVHKSLVTNPVIKNYLPETHLCKGMLDVIYMLAKYRQIYIKPASGSHGLGICWVTKANPGYFGHYINWHGEESAFKASNIRQLSAILSRFIGRRKYLVQQGLHLAYKNEKPADIRVLMQKNSEGLWKFTTFVARLAADGSRVSNFEHGGSLVSVYKLLKNSTNSKKTNYKAQKTTLINFSKSVCKQLEDSMQIDFAELGLDMAVDVNGRLWLIEVNSRPARDLTTEGQRVPQSARLSVRRIIDYAAWLSGFAFRSGGG